MRPSSIINLAESHKQGGGRVSLNPLLSPKCDQEATIKHKENVRGSLPGKLSVSERWAHSVSSAEWSGSPPPPGLWRIGPTSGARGACSPFHVQLLS